jgi:cytochrome c2
MKKTTLWGLGILTLVALAFLFVTPVVFADEAKADGKKLFTDNKCNTCHSIQSQGIEKTMASSKAPDLSDVGSTRDAEWISQFLQKKVDDDGKKHPKGWTGSEADLKTLSDWLASLKKKS